MAVQGEGGVIELVGEFAGLRVDLHIDVHGDKEDPLRGFRVDGGQDRVGLGDLANLLRIDRDRVLGGTALQFGLRRGGAGEGDRGAVGEEVGAEGPNKALIVLREGGIAQIGLDVLGKAGPVLQGEVDREAGGVRLRLALDPVEDGVVDRLQQALRLGRIEFCHVAGHIAQVDHVRSAAVAVAVVLGAAAGLGDLRDPLDVIQLGARLGDQGLDRLHDRIYLGEVRDGEGDLGVGLLRLGLRLETVGDHLAQGVTGDLRLVGHRAHDRRVIPAVSRLQLLRCDHELGVGAQQGCILDSRHETGVKADDLKGLAGGRDRIGDALLNAVQVEGDPVVQLIGTEAVDRAGAVVPEDQHVPLCGVVGLRPRDEVGQRTGVVQAGRAHSVIHQLHVVAGHQPALGPLIGDRQFPLAGAHGLHHNVDLLR